MIDLDTGIAYLHAMKHRRSGLIYDLMEPLRPIGDRQIHSFAVNQEFERMDFTFSVQGVCRLSDGLGRRLTNSNLPDELVSEQPMRLHDGIRGQD